MSIVRVIPIRIIALSIALATCAALFVASSVPNLIFVDNFLIDTAIRKVGHFVTFFVMAFAGCIALTDIAGPRAAVRLVVVAAAVVGLLDELSQREIAGRLASPIDVGIDIVGGLVGGIAFERASRHGRDHRGSKRPGNSQFEAGTGVEDYHGH